MMDQLFGETSPQIEIGSIGWEDEDEYFFPGEETNDGHTLVRVQLFRGRDFTQPQSDRAQGAKLVCHVPDGNFRVPAKNARCYVAIPSGMDNLPGAGIVIATVGGGNEVRRNITSGDNVIAPTGDDAGQAMIITKKDGSVTIHTTDSNASNGNSVFFRVSSTAFQFVAPWGRMIFDASGVHWTTKSGARFDMGGISIPGIGGLASSFDSYVKLQAATVKVAGGSVFLGNGAYYQPVVSTLPLVATNFLPVGIITAVPGPQPNLVGCPSVWAAAMA